MDNTDHYFKGQLQHEEILYVFRKHWVVILPYFIALLFFLLVLFFFILFEFSLGEAPIPSYYRIAFIPFLILLYYIFHRIFIKIFNYYFRLVVITSIRVVDMDKTIFLRDRTDAFNLDMIQDVKKEKQGLIQTLFNFGTIELYLPAMNVLKQIRYVPAPNHYFRCICKVRQDYIDRAGLPQKLLPGGAPEDHNKEE